MWSGRPRPLAFDFDFDLGFLTLRNQPKALINPQIPQFLSIGKNYTIAFNSMKAFQI